jgi:hypothetical protein
MTTECVISWQAISPSSRETEHAEEAEMFFQDVAVCRKVGSNYAPGISDDTSRWRVSDLHNVLTVKVGRQLNEGGGDVNVSSTALIAISKRRHHLRQCTCGVV